MTSAAGSVENTQRARRHSKKASMTHTTAVETQLATSCGMVLDMSDSRLETSPMRFSVSSERSRWLKKDMGSRRRCSARPMRVASVSRYAVTYVRR